MLCRPWLAFGCAAGARVKTPDGYATVCGVRSDDKVQVWYDGSGDAGKRTVATIDPRPDTVGRAARYEYKPGQKLLYRDEGEWVDAQVDEYYGVKEGSRHRVRLAGDGHHKAADGARLTKVVDLNESNHSKLLFPSVGRYEEARAAYCRDLVGKHTSVRDEATGKEMRAADQRLYLGGAADTRAAASPAPGAREPSPTTSGGAAAAAAGTHAAAASSPTAAGGDGGKFAADEAAADAAADAADALVSVGALLAELMAPLAEDVATPTPRLVRVGSKWEHELLLHHVLFVLAERLRVYDAAHDAAHGLVPLVPLCVPLARIVELMSDASVRQQSRSPIVRLFELDHPQQADMLKQAMEMRALVLVVDAAADVDVSGFKESYVDELLTHRLVLASVGSAERLPPPLVARCQHLELRALGLFLTDVKLLEKDNKEIFKRMRTRAAAPADGGGGTLLAAAPATSALNLADPFYCRVQALHIGASGDAGSDIGREALQSLGALLMSDACCLRTLDVSHAKVDCWELVQSLRSNASLTSLDVRGVGGMADLYETLASVLLLPGCPCRLGYLRCDAFEVLEGESALSLRETPLESGAASLLAGLLKHNLVLRDVDLSACDIDRAGAAALAKALETNKALTVLRLVYNPLIDDEGKKGLRDAVSKWRPSLSLLLS